MSEHDADAKIKGSREEEGEEETQPITLAGVRVDSSPSPPPSLTPPAPLATGAVPENSDKTGIWVRGAAPGPLPAVEEPPSPVAQPPPPVKQPARAPAAAPAAAPPPSLAPPTPALAEATALLDVERDVDPLGEAPTVVSGAAVSQRAAIPPSSSLHPMLLERVEPSLGRGERIRLDASHWSVSLGRADSNDIRLYTATASREHAVIAGNQRGQWVITPAAGKGVRIDGELCTEPVVLEVGMNLVMGTDHLRCVSEGLARPQMNAQTAADGLTSRKDRKRAFAGVGLLWWGIGFVALVGLSLIAFAWFGADAGG